MKQKCRELKHFEIEDLSILISKTNPYRLSPENRNTFEGIRDWFNKSLAKNDGRVWLSNAQIRAVKASYATAKRVQSKIDRPSHFDVNERLDVWANPAKPKS
jgi:hypothetical protein